MKNKRFAAAGALAFLLPVAVMLVVFGIKGIYPFGGRSFLSTDLYHQYMPFFSEFMRSIKSGQGIAYTWNVGVGSNFLALYVYYLASPFHWLGLLVPEAHIMEFITYLVVFKIGLCGLTAFVYLYNRGRNVKGGRDEWENIFPALFFSLAYALSGFLAAYNWNIMWLDCVILLPVIVLGLELLVREGRPWLYCVSLGLSIFTNFYISIMICIFLVLYFVFLYLTEAHSMPPAGADAAGRSGGRRRGADGKRTGAFRGRLKAHLRPIGQFALYSLLAGAMAAVLLIPEVCALMETDFGDINFPEKAESYFPVLDMLARHCVAVSAEKGLDHWPNIYCGAAVFLFVPLYAAETGIPARRRFGMLALSGIMLLGFSTNVLNFIWHGLNYPDSLPARQSFIYIMLVLIMCCDAGYHLDLRDGSRREHIIHVYLGSVAALLLVEKFAQHEDVLPGAEWLTLLFVTCYAAALYLAYTHRSGRWRMGLACFALTVMVAETGINTYVTSVSNVSRASYLEHQEDYKSLYEWVRGQEDGFYRLEKFTRKTKNDGTLAGYPTASVFSSTMNSAVMDLYKRLGMRHSKVYYGYDGATAFTGALLNVKYLFGESEEYENGLYHRCNSSDDISLYKAEYALPFGYVAPAGYDLPEEGDSSGLLLQNRMVHDLGIEERLFVKCERDSSGDDVSFNAPEAGIYYGIITASGTKKVKVSGGHPGEQEFNDLKDGAVLYLGYLDAGDFVTISNNDEDDSSKNLAADIYRMDEGVLRSAIEVLSEESLEQVEYSSTRLTGRLVLEREGRLILSVPYEKGWRVTLNGEEAEPELFGGTFMAFDLQPGEYELSMEYVPYGRLAGILVSAAGVLGFGGMLWLGKRKKRH